LVGTGQGGGSLAGDAGKFGATARPEMLDRRRLWQPPRSTVYIAPPVERALVLLIQIKN